MLFVLTAPILFAAWWASFPPSMQWIDVQRMTLAERERLKSTRSKEWRGNNMTELAGLVHFMQQSSVAHGFYCMAAVNVGVPVRVIVLQDKLLINPEIVSQAARETKEKETTAFDETRMVMQAEWVRVRYTGWLLEPREDEFSGSIGKCLQSAMRQF